MPLSRALFWWLFVVACWGAAPLWSAEPAPRPNVILFFVDDLGYADVGCYGARDIATPHIDRLAREGTRYTHFHVAQAVCTASRTGLLTGCYPNRLGMSGALNHTSRTGIHTDETLLSELFQKQGYATAVFGKWHLGHQPPFLPTRRGFDTWIGIPYSNDNGPLHPVIRDIPPLPYYHDEKVIETDPDQAHFTRRTTEQAVAFIRQARERPFLLYLPHIMPHVPIYAREQFLGQSQRGLYGDVVEELDWSVGEILATLKELKLDDNTLFIFFSDNGPFLSYGDHAGDARPFREGKLTTFEGGVRVPFIVRWPARAPAGRVSQEWITSLDLLPTLARLIDAPLPERAIDGIDLSPLLLGQPDARGRESFAYYAGDELHAVRQGRWKLHFPHEYLTVNGPPGKHGKPANHANMKPNAIEESGLRGIASRHGYKVEKLPLSLFDLEADPGETRNLAEQHPDIVRQLSQLGDTFRADLGDSLTGAKGEGVRPVGRVP